MTTTQPTPPTASPAPTLPPPTAPVTIDEGLPANRFLDRELSWLAFNQRVLELAEDDELPVLERAKFLAIFASNLDEFFMVRVAGLKRRIATGIAVRAASGYTPREVLENIWQRAYELQREQADLFRRGRAARPRGPGHPAAALGPAHPGREGARSSSSSTRRSSRS